MPSTVASPPKRMTRARAKAVEEKQNIKTIATPAAKAAKSAATKATKRKLCDDEDVNMPEAGSFKSQEHHTSARQQATARAMKAPVRKGTRKQPDIKETASMDEPTENETGSTAATKARGRPRKNTATKDDTQTNTAPSHAIPSTRATRARAEANARPLKAPVPIRKRVTFQNEDKENDIANTLSSRDDKSSSKPTAVATGSIRTTARAAPKKAGKLENEATQAPEQHRPQPLSPSKGMQTSVPIRPTSPIKESPSRIKVHGSPDKLGMMSHRVDEDDVFGDSLDELQATTKRSPVKSSAESIAGSPARRPPASPFKDSMKTSPMRIAMGSVTGISDDKAMAVNEPTLSQSPKKFNLAAAPAQPIFKMPQTKGPGNTLSQTPARRPASPLKMVERSEPQARTPFSTEKRSILQSSARRPPSGFQETRVATPSKPEQRDATLSPMTASLMSRSPLKIANSPSESMRSPLRVQSTPCGASKVHLMTPEEQAEALENELKVAPSPFSPAFDHGTASPSQARLPDKSSPSVSAQAARNIHTSPATPICPSHVAMFDHSAIGSHQQNPDILENDSSTPTDAPLEAFQFRSPTMEWGSDEGSEDELQTRDPRYDASPERRKSKAFVDLKTSSTPTVNAISAAQLSDTSKITMTALAQKFGAWSGGSPDQQVLDRRTQTRSLFSPVKKTLSSNPEQTAEQQQIVEQQAMPTPQLLSSFTEAMDIREDNDEDEFMPDAPENVQEVFRQSQASDASQEYGDENAVPFNPAPLVPVTVQTTAITPARLRAQPRKQILHTTSKVPLKAAADDTESPSSRPKTRRSRSLSGPLAARSGTIVDELFDQRFNAMGDLAVHGQSSALIEQIEPDTNTPTPATPHVKADDWSVVATPARTPRSNVNTKLLSGAVVHVDVHTTEGADASGIFVDLLVQMGAKCVKQWNWNPHTTNDDAVGADSRVGITHVVFKDGGKRTMEKVREAKGVVQCVGVGWVLDCERENNWLDEAGYTVDESTIPRGGHRRRKSMEPRLLSNSNGTLSSTTTPAKLAGSLSTPIRDLSPSQEFLNLESPVKSDQRCHTTARVTDRRVSFALPITDDASASSPASTELQTLSIDHAMPSSPDASSMLDHHTAFETPKPRNVRPAADGNCHDPVEYSPTTPYFLHGPSQIVQQTCPPKQTQELLFPISGRIEEQENENIRHRLVMARRKSLQFAPKVKSPLSKGFGDVL